MIFDLVKAILAFYFCLFILAFRIPLTILTYVVTQFYKTGRTPPSLYQRLTVTFVQTFQDYLPLWLLRKLFKLVGTSTLISSKKQKHWVKKLDASNEKDGWEGYFIADDVEHSEIGKDIDMLILYAHGGAFVCGDALGPLETFIDWIKAWKSSHRAKVQILSLEYELSPEKSFPAARDNMLACYNWLVTEKKISPSKIAFAGDSCGGNLAAVSALLLINQPHVFSLETPAALILLSPFLSGLTSAKSFVNNASYDTTSLRWFYSCLDAYIGDSNLLPSSPFISPLFENQLSQLPKVWISVGEYEIFLDDITSFTEKLLQNNVKAELVIEDANFHDYAAFKALSRNGGYENSIRQIGRFLFGE